MVESEFESESGNRVGRIEVVGSASEDEVAAISAAVQLLWPDPVPAQSAPKYSPWKFSGRHWAGSRSSWRLSHRD